MPRSIVRVNSYEQSVKVLKKDRKADAAVFSEPAYYYWVKELGYKTSDFGDVIIIEPNKKQWILVRKNLSFKKRDKLKKVIDKIYKEGLYQSLLKKYGKK